MRFTHSHLLFFIILISFLIRFFPIDFPSFSSDEARIAYRGYTLATTGKDELGRSLPIIFNSLNDYQLPVVSYITAFGILIFGKTDLGARIPFILIGTVTVLLIYKLSQFFLKKENLSFYAVLIACFSPGLIFFSKFPNEFIVATCLILVLTVQLLKEKINKLIVFFILLLILLTSKILWFSLIPIVTLTLLLNNKITRREKINLLILCLILVFLAFFFYLIIPQGMRSLIENNFLIVNDVTIKNGIEKLRGQMIAGWPIFWDKILFNKAYFIAISIFHWLSHLSLSNLFAELDNTNNFGFLKLGVFPKVVIIPFLTGLFVVIKENTKRINFLFLYIIFVTFPLLFLYPVKRSEFIILILPFITLISALGFRALNWKVSVLLVTFLILELGINFSFIPASIKNANGHRPDWIKKMILDGYSLSPKYNVGFSDNISPDIVPFIEWYAEFDVKSGFEDVKFPYRFRQLNISNIKIIGSENTFYNCSLDKPTFIFAAKRDLQKIQNNIKVLPEKSYKDSLGNDVVYVLPPKICIH